MFSCTAGGHGSCGLTWVARSREQRGFHELGAWPMILFLSVQQLTRASSSSEPNPALQDLLPEHPWHSQPELRNWLLSAGSEGGYQGVKGGFKVPPGVTAQWVRHSPVKKLCSRP